MINRVGAICIFVSDQDRAIEFYTKKLGFELRTDMPHYPGAASRWVSVAPQGAETEIILNLLDDNWKHYQQVLGQSQAIIFDVTDINTLYADLKAKGVTILNEPQKQGWGTFVSIQDSEGNTLLLVEQIKP